MAQMVSAGKRIPSDTIIYLRRILSAKDRMAAKKAATFWM
jgi:hypothetical protein